MRRSSVITTIALVIAAVATEAEAKLDLYVDKSTQQISIIQNGYLLYIWPVSTGRDRFSTPSGVYKPERLETSWFSKAYYNAPMPHAIFFHNGYAIHGSYDIAQLGGPASHGCVRLHPQDAALLFAMVQQEGPGSTTIVVGGDRPPGPSAPRYRGLDDQFRSAYRGDGEIARGAYAPNPKMAPYYDADRMADRSAPRYRGLDDQFGSPYRGDGGIARGAYAANPKIAPYYDADRMADRMAPYYSADRYVEAPGRRRIDNNQFAMRSISPGVRAPAPRRDAEMPPRPATGPRGSNRPPLATIKLSPKPDHEPDETANHHANASDPVKSPPPASPPPSEPEQASTGYKIFPKSYWAGASWRWRRKSDEEPR